MKAAFFGLVSFLGLSAATLAFAVDTGSLADVESFCGPGGTRGGHGAPCTRPGSGRGHEDGRRHWNGARARWGSYPEHFWSGPYPKGDTWVCVTVDSEKAVYQDDGYRQGAADLSLDDCYDNSSDPASCTLQVCA